jgi:multidrug efflux pump subunit AcrB
VVHLFSPTGVYDVANALQVNLGSLYVNVFNRFGRTYQVVAQADEEFRKKPSDLLTLKVRNKRGQLVPLGSVVKVSDSSGPDRAEYYNSYLTAPINGSPGKLFALVGVHIDGGDNNVFTLMC